MRAILPGLAAVGLWLGPACADSASGPYALALAGVIAPNDPSLAPAKRHVVAALFAGNQAVAYPAGASIVVQADKVVCRVSNVEITARSCQLVFHNHTRNLSGAKANAVFATLASAGVPPDGAAGSTFEAVHGLACALTPSVIRQNGGGGATCSFTPGP